MTAIPSKTKSPPKSFIWGESAGACISVSGCAHASKGRQVRLNVQSEKSIPTRIGEAVFFIKVPLFGCCQFFADKLHRFVRFLFFFFWRWNNALFLESQTLRGLYPCMHKLR